MSEERISSLERRFDSLSGWLTKVDERSQTHDRIIEGMSIKDEWMKSSIKAFDERTDAIVKDFDLLVKDIDLRFREQNKEFGDKFSEVLMISENNGNLLKNYIENQLIKETTANEIAEKQEKERKKKIDTTKLVISIVGSLIALKEIYEVVKPFIQ